MPGGHHAGFVCAHTHLYSGLAPLGLPAPDVPPENFVEILERVWWRLDRALDRDSLRASARLYIAEALLAGTTVVIDHHESPEFIAGSLDVLADAAQDLGIRALVGYGATERNGGLAEAEAGLEECERFIRHNERPLVRGCVALHASFTVSDATLTRSARLCSALGVPMHVHLAEDQADVRDAMDRGYDGPLERMLALGSLPAGSLAAHGVHLTRQQVARASSLGIWFIQNPRSNEGNQVGFAAHLDAASHVALGTDGYPADMLVERHALERIGGDTNVADTRLAAGRQLARSLFGAEVDHDRVEVSQQGTVETVVVAGRKVVQDGALASGDMEAIRHEARVQAERLWGKMAEL